MQKAKRIYFEIVGTHTEIFGKPSECTKSKLIKQKENVTDFIMNGSGMFVLLPSKQFLLIFCEWIPLRSLYLLKNTCTISILYPLRSLCVTCAPVYNFQLFFTWLASFIWNFICIITFCRCIQTIFHFSCPKLTHIQEPADFTTTHSFKSLKNSPRLHLRILWTMNDSQNATIHFEVQNRKQVCL